MDYSAQDFKDLITVATYIISACAIIAAKTPTLKDDTFFSRLLSIVDILGFNVGGARSEERVTTKGEPIGAGKDAWNLLKHVIRGRK